MSALEDVKRDITVAMKAGEKTRVSALRLLLSELQRDAKEGANDEVAVLRRERKRRLEAAETYREAGRDELEAGERSEADLIASYLPAEISDDELQAAVAAAVEQTGASSPKDMGQVMKQVMATVGDRADGKRVSQAVKGALTGG
ncbi:MAG: GatB/YqeY domain-containing protein [Patulibacter sp.]|nr:GatB/YqeY domain-containing protein [Patulibacter sp.]